MIKKWKDILADKATYGDDFVITLKDGQTMSLGDMRSYDAEHEGELTQRLTAKEQEIGKREKAVNDASIQLATVIEKTAQQAGLSVEEFLSGKAPTKRSVAESTDLDENDPLVGKLVKEIKGLQAKVGQQDTTIAALKKDALGPMLNTYLEDFYESRWDKLSTSLPEGSKLELKEAIEYANKNGYKDSKGRLDLGKAIKDLTYEDRVKVEARKLAGEERKKMEDEMALRAAPRPSQLGQRVKPDKGVLNEKGMVKSFDEVLNDAVNDADLWKGIAQA